MPLEIPRTSDERCRPTDLLESKFLHRCMLRSRMEADKFSYGGDVSLFLDDTSKFTLSNDILTLSREYVTSNGAFETD